MADPKQPIQEQPDNHGLGGNEAKEQDPRIPKPGEKLDIPVPKRPGASITIGPEGPYSSSYIPGEDTDAE